MRHDLRKLWRRFKKEFGGGGGLDRFDSTIDGLHAFERIRYPEEIVARGMRSEIGFGEPSPETAYTGPKLPRYNVSVEKIDELVEAIFTTTDINPQFFASGLKNEVLKVLQHHNRTTLWEVPGRIIT
jgi:hypothetical protein